MLGTGRSTVETTLCEKSKFMLRWFDCLVVLRMQDIIQHRFASAFITRSSSMQRSPVLFPDTFGNRNNVVIPIIPWTILVPGSRTFRDSFTESGDISNHDAGNSSHSL